MLSAGDSQDAFGPACETLEVLVRDVLAPGLKFGVRVPVRSEVDTPCASVVRGVCVVEGAFCDAVSSDVLVGKAIGAESSRMRASSEPSGEGCPEQGGRSSSRSDSCKTSEPML